MDQWTAAGLGPRRVDEAMPRVAHALQLQNRKGRATPEVSRR